MEYVFVINAGSSSLKYQLFDMETEKPVVQGNCERIGRPGGVISYKYGGKKLEIEMDLPDHRAALEKVFSLLQNGETRAVQNADEIVAVGHRIAFSKSPKADEITPEIVENIISVTEMAPLHIPAMVSGIKACREIFPGKLQAAVYDTSFHYTMPPKAYMYALPYELYEKYGIRRYGYHGISHRYISLRAAELMHSEKLRLICCHLGSGSSVTAIDGGKSVDTSMGYAPLAGLMMGTRCGDIDPSLVGTIAHKTQKSCEEVTELLNKESGFLGISGVSNDNRDVTEAAGKGNKRAQLSQEMFVYQIQKYIGAYAAAMNGLDALVFTGGIGENADYIREAVCSHMDFFGIALDKEKNAGFRSEGCISKPESRVQVWVIPTNEELMIAKDAYGLWKARNK